jgi:hypothetical protein
MGPWSTISKLGAQDALINTLISQVGLPIHPLNHVVEALVAMTLNPLMSK